METNEIFHCKGFRVWGCTNSCRRKHGEASKRLVSRFESLVDALDTLISGKAAPDIKGIRDELFEPNTILMLLLLSDVLAHVNRFLRYLQTRNLIYSTVSRKFSQLIESLTKLLNADGALFTEFALPFLLLSKKRIMLSRRLRCHNLIEEEDLYTLITKFKSNVKTPFMNDLIAELNDALKINDPVLLAFDVFNVCVNFPEKERKHHTEVLLTFYGIAQSSTFQSNNSVAPAVLNSMVDDLIVDKIFF